LWCTAIDETGIFRPPWCREPHDDKIMEEHSSVIICTVE
jgi:hypothetical protein